MREGEGREEEGEDEERKENRSKSISLKQRTHVMIEEPYLYEVFRCLLHTSHHLRVSQ